MTTVIERSDTAVKERPRVRPPEPTAPRPRPRRAWYAWMVSLIVVAVAATAAILLITDDDAATTIDYASGESVYMQYDWYADLEGYYLPPPALAPSGESVYMEYDWYAAMGGYYLPKPYGDLTPDSHYGWLVERGLIPEASTATFEYANADYSFLVANGIIPEAYGLDVPGYEWLVERGIIPEAFGPAAS